MDVSPITTPIITHVEINGVGQVDSMLSLLDEHDDKAVALNEQRSPRGMTHGRPIEEGLTARRPVGAVSPGGWLGIGSVRWTKGDEDVSHSGS